MPWALDRRDMALVALESTFLASLNVERQQAQGRQQKRKELLENSESGQQILKLHADLQSLGDDLDERVEGRLNANENAYFLAYEHFMHDVQKEFKELKKKCNEEETKNRRDAKIQSLEKELDWFMHEALRLDELCKKHKQDLDKWKSKAEALEDDRQFLENSIKNAKKNNKTLRGKVEKAQTSAYTALVAADRPPPSPAREDTRALPDQAATMAIEDVGAGSGLSQELEQRYQNCVQRLKQQLETEQRLAAKLRAVSDRQFAEPSELEAFFVESVESVKGDIAERRRRTAAANSQAKSRIRSDSVPPVIPTAPPTTLDDFTASDRRKVIEQLLSSEEVLQFLYDKLFPQGRT